MLNESVRLSGREAREEEDGFLKGRVSKKAGIEGGIERGEAIGSGEVSFALRFPPSAVLREEAIVVTVVPMESAFGTFSLLGVPTLGNRHFS
jgi:hypothetical protein